jgi:hypothetical protein
VGFEVFGGLEVLSDHVEAEFEDEDCSEAGWVYAYSGVLIGNG